VAQVAQISCGCPLPSSVQGQVGRGLEQPGLVGGWNEVIFKALLGLARTGLIFTGLQEGAPGVGGGG